ncbi:hypothetical protein CTAYLR_003381 [Chrysophaeum taylorii]|uniref:Protein phosphatase n=1 Tax=Chrysophaeum taylorii TaxID=2483200 RepID=A0AAD7XPR7_9STRA|nr:hypothetical protein CTAYLR_003381 [Chrysophaeum taylorii]
MVVGAASRPQRDKGRGEDAYVGDSTIGLLGVADGVGGSKSETVDPGDFSRRLLALCQQHAREDGSLRAVEVLARARKSAATDEVARKGGSSTVVLAKLSGDQLEVCNYGDSGVVVLRPAIRQFKDVDVDATPKRRLVLFPRVVLRSNDQVYFFNAPYQASAADDLAQTPAMLGSCEPDVISATVRPGDLVLAATDGLWDNVDEIIVQNLVATYVPTLWASAGRSGLLPDGVATISDAPAASDPTRDRLEALAATLADEAVKVYDDSDPRLTPFARAARAEGIDHSGGKEDDVCVLAALILPDAAILPAFDEVPSENLMVASS